MTVATDLLFQDLPARYNRIRVPSSFSHRLTSGGLEGADDNQKPVSEEGAIVHLTLASCSSPSLSDHFVSFSGSALVITILASS